MKKGDLVIYKSRKNNRKYIGVFIRSYHDMFNREIAEIWHQKIPDRQVANPFMKDVELLTDERHMLLKLENA